MTIVLPGDPEFEETLALTLPLNWRAIAHQYGGDYGFVADSQSGFLRIENSRGIREYVEGGEYDERLVGIEDDSDDEFDWEV